MGHLSLIGQDVVVRGQALASEIGALPAAERIEALNAIRLALHEASPFKDEPTDCVLWVKSDQLLANDYNPNVVAPAQMQLLERSIERDGFTQPIVAGQKQEDGTHETVDGFHRGVVGKDSKVIRARLMGYLPIVMIRADRTDREARIAATVRHNVAKGAHTVEGESDIVIELSRRNWSDEKIGRELGMSPDKVLRLKQVSGLAELFSDRAFSEAWEID